MGGPSWNMGEEKSPLCPPPCQPAHFLRERMPGTSESYTILGPAWHDVRRVWGQGSLLGPISKMRSSEKVCKHLAKLRSYRAGFSYSGLAQPPGSEGVRGGQGPGDLTDASWREGIQSWSLSSARTAGNSLRPPFAKVTWMCPAGSLRPNPGIALRPVAWLCPSRSLGEQAKNPTVKGDAWELWKELEEGQSGKVSWRGHQP